MTSPAPTHDTRDRDEIERRDTATRAGLTILFWIVRGLVDSAIGLIVIFSVFFAGVTRRAPSARVRSLANRIVTYEYRIGRYLTFNDSRVPFPFSDFPEPLEECHWTPDLRESEILGLGRRDREPSDDPPYEDSDPS